MPEVYDRFIATAIQTTKPFPIPFTDSKAPGNWLADPLSQFDPETAVNENKTYHPAFKSAMERFAGIITPQAMPFQLEMTGASNIDGFRSAKKPDFTGFRHGCPNNAENIVLFIELMIQKSGSKWDKEHVVHIMGYCERALHAQPLRQFIYGALCNNKVFQLFRVQRNTDRLRDRAAHWVTYEAYPTVTLHSDAGFLQLKALFTASSAQLGMVPLPLITVDGKTLSVEIDTAIGFGAHAAVYKAHLDGHEYAVKVFPEPSVCRTEVDVLKHLASKHVPFVPRVINSRIAAELGDLPQPSWIVVQPLASHINPLVFHELHVRDVIECLRAAHTAGYVCRDVRIANIMEHQGHAYIVDWNSAAKIGVAALPSGTVRCAPDHVLVAIENRESYTPAARDDLISFVRLILLRVRVMLILKIAC